MATLLITTPGAGSWTVPSGVTRVAVSMVGAGGGGGGDDATAMPRVGQGGLGRTGLYTGGDGTLGGGGGGAASTFSTLEAPGGGGGSLTFTGSLGGRGGGNNAGAGGFGSTTFSSGGSGGSGASGRGSSGISATGTGRGGNSGARTIARLAPYGVGGNGNRVGTRLGAGGGGGGYIERTIAVTPGSSVGYFVAFPGLPGGTGRFVGQRGIGGGILLTWADNVAPTVVINNPAQTVKEGELVQMSITAADSDGTIESYAWTTTLGTFSSTTIANPIWTPPEQTRDAQTATLTITVTDNRSATATASVDFTIAALDRIALGGTLIDHLALGSTQYRAVGFNGNLYAA